MAKFALGPTSISKIGIGNDTDINAVTFPYIVATGGTVTTSGNFKIHTFTSSGNFDVSSIGNSYAELLVVAGGGSGGNFGGGGGGAGGLIYSSSATITLVTTLLLST